MREYRLHDIAIYFVLAAVYMANNYPLINVAEFYLRNASFFIHLFVDVLIKGFVEPLDAKDRVGQEGTLHQHILIRVFRSFLAGLPNFCKDDPAYSFIANDVWKRLFEIRSFLQCHNGTDMSHYESGMDGVWIKKNFREDDFDLIVFYVPNVAILGSSPFVYLEYLTTLHNLLMLDGFDNPAVYIASLPHEVDKWDYESVLAWLMEAYKGVSETYPGAKVVLYGDSMGANMVQSMLLQGANPVTAVLCSPIPTWTIASRIRKKIPNLDYLNPVVVERVFNSYFPGEKPGNPTDPGAAAANVNADDDSAALTLDVDAWKEAMPEKGIVLTWGDCEYLDQEIAKLGAALSECGRVKLWKQADAVHCWPMMAFLTEDSEEEKEDSCFLMAGTLSRIVLWETDRYLDPNGAREPMNVLTIDDSHL